MSGSEPSTQELVTAAQGGDELARDTLFRRYLPRVAQMVAVQLGVPRDKLPPSAEDVAQDAIVRALKGLTNFEVRGRGAFTAWLATIVENCVRNHHRARNGTAERALWQRYGDLDLTESFFPGTEPTPSRLIAGADANRVIEAAMLELPALSRRVLSLRYFAGMSHAEVAQEIGHTEANSRKLAQRALDGLRASVAKTRP